MDPPQTDRWVILLAAAADEFAERGLDASVADIARRAGVAKGTVFRHFVTKDDLIAAIVLDRIDALTMVGERLLEAADPGAALLEFLTAAAYQRQQRDLSFLQEAGDLTAEVSRGRDQMFHVVHTLLKRAREHGTVRNDVTTYMPDAPPDLWRRYLAIIFDGLRPEGAHPLPHPPPSTP